MRGVWSTTWKFRWSLYSPTNVAPRPEKEERVSSTGLDPVSSSHSGRVGKRYYTISPRVEWRVDWINRRTCITVQVSSKVACQFVSCPGPLFPRRAERKFPTALNRNEWNCRTRFFSSHDNVSPEAPEFCRFSVLSTSNQLFLISYFHVECLSVADEIYIFDLMEMRAKNLPQNWTSTTCAGNWLRTITSDRAVHNNSSLSFRTLNFKANFFLAQSRRQHSNLIVPLKSARERSNSDFMILDP